MYIYMSELFNILFEGEIYIQRLVPSNHSHDELPPSLFLFVWAADQRRTDTNIIYMYKRSCIKAFLKSASMNK
jgi:hypothetical protein